MAATSSGCPVVTRNSISAVKIYKSDTPSNGQTSPTATKGRRRRRVALQAAVSQGDIRRNRQRWTRDKRGDLAYAPWHFLYFFPLPQGQGSLRPTLSSLRCTVWTVAGSSPRLSVSFG